MFSERSCSRIRGFLSLSLLLCFSLDFADQKHKGHLHVGSVNPSSRQVGFEDEHSWPSILLLCQCQANAFKAALAAPGIFDLQDGMIGQAGISEGFGG